MERYLVRAFQELGETVEREWAAADFRGDAFAAIAERALAVRRAVVTPDEIVQWALTSELPQQHDLDASFGQPPVTLFAHERFVVVALFWVDGTTSIHQHAFAGAFQVLAGTSLHARFGFEGAMLTERLGTGVLRVQEMELLRAGDVRAIRAGNELVHSLFHLDRPSVTLLVRTRGDHGAGRQFAYLPPSVAFDPFQRDATLQRRQQLLGLVFGTRPEHFASAAATVIDASDVEGAFHVLRQARKIDTVQTFQALVAHATARHGASIDALVPAIEEERRRADIAELRNRVVDPELRYFLALLLNAPHREGVLALTRAAVPTAEPVETLVGWLRRLADVRFAIQAGPATFEVSATGFAVDDAMLAVARRMLDGEVLSDEDAHATTLRRSPLLAALFRA